MPRILPWMGYQWNFHKAVVYGSKYAGGIGYTHLQAYQLGAKVTGAMHHVQANTKLGGGNSLSWCNGHKCVQAPVYQC
eukprot:13433530-Ditylum_brightwellii.AAC.1